MHCVSRQYVNTEKLIAEEYDECSVTNTFSIRPVKSAHHSHSSYKDKKCQACLDSIQFLGAIIFHYFLHVRMQFLKCWSY